MTHSSDKRTKDFAKVLSHDWAGKDLSTSITSKFFKLDRLATDGFIHQDGSLRFEFEVIKQKP